MTRPSPSNLLLSLVALGSLAAGCASDPSHGDSARAAAGSGGSGATGASAATGGDGASGGTGATGGTVGTGPGSAVCPPDIVCTTGIPFVTGVFANTDVLGPGHPAMVPGATTAALTIPEPGKLCLTGTTVNGFAAVALTFMTEHDGVVQNGLDVQALGAKSVRLTLEKPPAPGLGVELASVSPSCHLKDDGCVHYGYYWSTSPPAFAPAQISAAGAMEAPFANFLRAEWIDSSWDLDLRNVATLSVGYGIPWATSGDFAFCVKDFAFLDADGKPIAP